MKNSSTTYQQLQLLQPGSQGWKNPKLKRKVSSTSSLTTKQVQQRYQVCDKDLRNCRIGVVLRSPSYCFCHIGRDKWEIYYKES